MKREAIIKNAAGLHARPASIFVQEANKFKSEINIFKNDKKINAKSIMEIMASGISKGTKIVIESKGEDEKLALEKLLELIENKFGEE